VHSTIDREPYDVRRTCFLLTVAAVSLPAAPAADEPLLQFLGNSWERGMYAGRTEGALPDPGRSDAGPAPRGEGSGRQMSAVGELTGVATPLVWNPLAFSVSWSLKGLGLVRERRIGATRVSEYDGGRIAFYADAPAASIRYGTNPPNSTVPAEFEDGYSVYLEGFLRDVRLTFDEATGLGTLDGRVRFVGGDAFRLLEHPAGWILRASLRRGSPVGYSFQIAGSLARDGGATSVEPRSWATVKGRFR
jgi:hypothetical protein